jgi:hypothetical protein
MAQPGWNNETGPIEPRVMAKVIAGLPWVGLSVKISQTGLSCALQVQEFSAVVEYYTASPIGHTGDT